MLFCFIASLKGSHPHFLSKPFPAMPAQPRPQRPTCTLLPSALRIPLVLPHENVGSVGQGFRVLQTAVCGCLEWCWHMMGAGCVFVEQDCDQSSVHVECSLCHTPC